MSFTPNAVIESTQRFGMSTAAPPPPTCRRALPTALTATLMVAALTGRGEAQSQWVLRGLLEAETGNFQAAFGAHIIETGAYLIISEPGAEVQLDLESGKVHIYQGPQRTRISTLTAPDLPPDASFGSFLVLDDTILAIGAPGAGKQYSLGGAVYFFDITDPAHPTYVRTLVRPERERDDSFGSALAINEDLMIVGAWGSSLAAFVAGATFVFAKDTHELLATVLASDATEADHFGQETVLDGASLYITAPSADSGVEHVGAVYVYDITDPAQPIETIKLTSVDQQSGDSFGSSIAVDGDDLFIGEARSGRRGKKGHVYRLDKRTLELKTLYTSNTGDWQDVFGAEVAVSETLVAVSAFGDEVNIARPGAVYLFDRASGTQLIRLTPHDWATTSKVGRDVCFSAAGEVIVSTGAEAGVGDVRFFTTQPVSVFTELSGNCPGRMTLRVTNATPNGVVYLLFGRYAGTEFAPIVYCRTTQLNVVDPYHPSAPYLGVADASGVFEVTLPVEAALCGDIFLQAVDTSTCRPSELLRVE